MAVTQEPNSVLLHATGGQYLGGVADGVDAGQYYRVAKADGGYDYYRVMPNGYDVQQTSEQDVGVALKADLLSQQPIQAETGTMATSTSGTGTTLNNVSYNGHVYNLDDPTQLNNFLSVRNADYLQSYNDANAQLDLNAQRDIESTNRTYGDKLNDYNKNLNLFNTNSDDYAKSLADLYEGYGQGNVARQNYFTRLAPDTYQSGQGSSFNYATDKYRQGYNETNNARNEWKAGLDQGLSRLGTDYGNWMNDYQRSLASQKAANAQTYNTNRDSMSNSVLGLGKSLGKAAFSPVDVNAQKQVDLSSYTPYTTFQGLGTSAAANLFKKFQPTQSQDPLSQTLGYTLPTATKDPLNSYLYK